MDIDILLIVGTFRRSSLYLSIIRELSKEYKVGISPPLENVATQKAKTAETDDLFYAFCKSLGAIQIDKNEVIQCKITILPQWDYNRSHLEYLKNNIKSKKIFWMVGLTMGNFQYEKLKGIKIDKLLTIDLDLYQYRMTVRPIENEFSIAKNKLVETGLPFKKYPVFPDWGIDYLWASPTPLSLPTKQNKLDYLRCVHKLLKNMPATDTVVYKPHNGDERKDYVVNYRLLVFLKIASALLLRKSVLVVTKLFFSRFFGTFGRNLTIDIQAADLYLSIMKRVRLLKEITKYYNFSLESFIPSVKKGLITGRSNSIWHALFVRIPVFNCVDGDTVEGNKEKMNYYSMQYFGVPYCNSNLEFDEKYFNIVKDRVRNQDFISFMQVELNTVEW